MKQAFVLLILSIICFSCNQTHDILGNWRVLNWTGDSYTVFNLRPDSTKSKFDKFVYALFAERNAKLIFNKDLTFAFDANSSKHFKGKFEYKAGNSLNLIIEDRRLSFTILNETNDSILLYTPLSEQIQARNLKLSIVR